MNKKYNVLKTIFGISLFIFLFSALSIESYADSCPSCGSSNVFVVENTTPCTDGSREGVCYDCNYSWSEFVPAEHSYSVVTTPATTTSMGLKEYTCSNCGDYYTEEIPMLDPDPGTAPAGGDPTTGAGAGTSGTTGAGTGTAGGDPTTGAGAGTSGTAGAGTGTTGGDPTTGAGTGTTGGGEPSTGSGTGTMAGTAEPGTAGALSEGGIIATAGTDGNASASSDTGAKTEKPATEEPTLLTGDEPLDILPGKGDAEPDGKGFFSKQVSLDEGGTATSTVSDMFSDMGAAFVDLWNNMSKTAKIVVAAIAVSGVGGGAAYVTIHASKVAKAAKAAKDVKLAKELGEVIELSSKKVLVCVGKEKAGNDLISHLKKRQFLTVVETKLKDAETLLKDIEDNEPELLIISGDCLYCIDDIKEAADGVIITALASKKSYKEKLENLKKEKKLDGFSFEEKYSEKMMVDLVLPIYKSEINTENGLEAVGSIADALGIPFVSTVTTLINEGKNVRDTIKDKDFSVSGVNGIVSSIAEVMGFDGIGNITTMIDNAGVVKEKREVAKNNKKVQEDESDGDDDAKA